MISPRLFIHRHYDIIKLVGIYVNVFLAASLFLYAIALNTEGVKRSNEAVEKIVQSAKDENERQTDILEKQLQALCLVVVETAGEEALQQLDPEISDKCSNLSGEPVNPSNSRPQSTPSTQSESTAETRNPQTSGGNSGNGTPQPNPPQPSLLQQAVNGVTGLVDNTLKALGL